MYSGLDKFSLLTDFYELTMMNGYLQAGYRDKVAYFEYYFRSVPDGGGFAITCGLQSFIRYIQNLNFSENEIEFLRKKKVFPEKFLSELRNYKFKGDVWAIPEGTPVFPNEPIVVVRGAVFETQLIETALLLYFNHQSLIATKANRIVRAAKGRPVFEFGARRAQGVSAAVVGARSAYIGGCAGTSNVLAELEYGVPALGTMAHSWVQSFPSEYEAFKAYAESYPGNCNLLIDTYDVLKSGLPNAVKIFEEVLKPLGKRPTGVRIDSGDIAYLSKRIRNILDESGYEDCPIVASNSLDEYIIRDLLLQEAKVDSFGVGERLITSKSSPVFGGVYKLVAVEKDGLIENKIKISENVEKITTPGFKQVWRFFSRDTNKALADLVSFFDEEIDDSKDIEIFHPQNTWKRKIISNFRAEKLLKPIFNNGELVYEQKNVEEIKKYCLNSVDYLWDEVKRFENPHTYIVDLSYDVWNVKTKMIENLDQNKNDFVRKKKI